jgi:hypothetical protein
VRMASLLPPATAVIDFIVCWHRSGRGYPAGFEGPPDEKMHIDQAGEFSPEPGFLTERRSGLSRRSAGMC